MPGEGGNFYELRKCGDGECAGARVIEKQNAKDKAQR